MTGLQIQLPKSSPYPPSKPLITKTGTLLITISVLPVTPRPAASAYTAKLGTFFAINTNYTDCMLRRGPL